MNPETRYTNRVRKLLKEWYPDIVIVKHSDQFQSGIADLHASLPTAQTIWIEFKYIKHIKAHRNGKVTDLQEYYLLDHLAVGVPSYVLIGTDKNKGHMLYRIDHYDGSAYREDVMNDDQLRERLKWTV